MITEQGQRALLGYLSARYSKWADGIVIGIGDQAEASNDNDLQFPIEVARVDIVVPEQLTQSLIARATFTPQSHAQIYEIGILNDISTYDIQHIVSFDHLAEPFTGGTTELELGRYGLRSTRVSAPGSLVYTAQNQDFERYTQQALFSLATNHADTGTSTIEVRVGQDETNYYNYYIPVAPGSGYVVSNWLKADFAAVGFPTWTNITYIEFVLTGDPDIVFDGFAVRTERQNPDVLFVARQVLDTPIQKLTTHNMDVEYRLRTNFG